MQEYPSSQVSLVSGNQHSSSQSLMDQQLRMDIDSNSKEQAALPHDNDYDQSNSNHASHNSPSESNLNGIASLPPQHNSFNNEQPSDQQLPQVANSSSHQSLQNGDGITYNSINNGQIVNQDQNNININVPADLTPAAHNNERPTNNRTRPQAPKLSQQPRGLHYQQNLPLNHLAVVKLRAWDPAFPQSTYEFTCTSNVGYDDGRSKLLSLSRLSHISEVENEDEADADEHDDHYLDDNASPEAIMNGEVVDSKHNDAKGKHDNDICAGSYIGMHLDLNNMLLSNEHDKNITWHVDDAINMRNGINLIPHTDISRVIQLVETNHPSVQTLIMDGLPPFTFTEAEAHEFAIALGEKNTNIHTLSIRHSNITDEVANMFALALTDNTTLKRFSLEGNQLSQATAKNFFTVISRNNKTLLSLDLRNNASIDGEILEAIDQFMHQREIRRKLLERGNEGDNDGLIYNSVTFVCHESILEGTYDPQTTVLDQASDPPELSVDMSPLPNESFILYMQRMNPQQKNKLKGAAMSVLASKRLYSESRRDMIQGSQRTLSSNGEDYVHMRTLSSNGEDYVHMRTLSSNGEDVGDQKDSSSRTSRESQKRLKRGDTTSSRESQKRRQLPRELLGQSSHFNGSTIPSSRQSSFTSRSSSEPSQKSARRINSSRELEEAENNDEQNLKSLARSTGEVGMVQINEAAPGRQNRRSGRRNRTPMTQSQRLARLSALTDGGDNTSSKRASALNASAMTAHSYAIDEEGYYIGMRASYGDDEVYSDNHMQSLDRHRGHSTFGLDDPELKMDCFLCTCIIFLAVIMIVMVMIYFMFG